MGHPRPAAPRFSPNYSKLVRGHDVPFKFHRADAAWPRHASYANLMTSLGPAVSVRVPPVGAWLSLVEHLVRDTAEIHRFGVA